MKQSHVEENNNELDELSKDFSKMGCIINTAKNPQNICFENCTPKDKSEGSDIEGTEEIKTITDNIEDEADGYSDEFEEDKSEIEEQLLEINTNLIKQYDREDRLSSDKRLNSSKSQHSSIPFRVSVSDKSIGYGGIGIKSGMESTIGTEPRSKSKVRPEPKLSTGLESKTNLGTELELSVIVIGVENETDIEIAIDRSIPVPQTRRINMSFTNDRLREIERQNHVLLNKIRSARNIKKSSIATRDTSVPKFIPPAAKQRRENLKRIEYENMILLKKIQRAKSSSYSIRR
ncbi:hypothetical protein EVAR_88956_1 [Eumeta japonica]|uniref:Cilia-and flagella-associated protein 97 n=1 Tax=Eumeta variegata TaxID=151549 RepID=A0A4C1VSW3_EUMVA|nr:hypothetical protein EVAR_88956_1 [Eumeta japonica]